MNEITKKNFIEKLKECNMFPVDSRSASTSSSLKKTGPEDEYSEMVRLIVSLPSRLAVSGIFIQNRGLMTLTLSLISCVILQIDSNQLLTRITSLLRTTQLASATQERELQIRELVDALLNAFCESVHFASHSTEMPNSWMSQFSEVSDQSHF